MGKKKAKGREGRKSNRREREGEIKTKRGFRFSLRSMEIGSSVFIGARSKVDPHNEGYVWVPKSRSFVKLQEVGNFPTLNIFSLKAM